MPPMPADDAAPVRATVRDHLQQGRAAGMAVPELDSPPCPAEIAYLLDWFLELSNSRGSNGFAPSPISYSEIAAWSRLTGVQPTPFEVAILRQLDACYLRNWASAERLGHRDPGK